MNVEELKETLKSDFCQSFDLVLLQRKIGELDCLYAYFDGMIDKELLENGVISKLFAAPTINGNIDIKYLYNNTSSSGKIEEIENFLEAENTLTEGFVVLFVDDLFFSIDLRKMEKRSITEPPTSSVLKGPRTGFLEEIAVNVSLIRRRIKNKDLVIQSLTVGKYTQHGCCMLDFEHCR